MPFVLANIFQPLINVFEAVLVFIHDNVVGGSWGFAIVGLTIVVRAALLPLTLKQVKSMQAMQRLAPEIKLLQAKYKDDRQRLNQEMMKFYQENKVNPFGSCLPLAAQLPVFLSLFYMLRKELKLDICGPSHLHGAALAHAQALAAQYHQTVTQFITGSHPGNSCDNLLKGSAKFLFVPDITHSAKGAVLIVLIVLYVGSQLASSLLMTVTADRNQRMMMLGLPFLFTFFILSFPAGLIVYWITTNVWTIGQQYIIRRGAGAVPPVPPPSDNGGARAKSLPKAPSPEPATAAVAAGAGGGGRRSRGGSTEKKAEPATRSGPPPSSPRKKKKRSGRRR
jgi:YidC/Oxa1 family membrane protein insertase